MKTIALLCCLLLPLAAPAQTAVDRAAHEIDSLCSFSFDNWKMSPDLKALKNLAGDPAKPGFDDSGWETLKLKQWVYPDSCWLRKEFVLPDRILGQPVGGSVHFLVTVDDFGYLWVNGEARGMFPWDGDFVLTTDAKPGQRFTLAIKAVNTGGPLRLLRAEIIVDRARATQQHFRDLALSLRTGQKLLSFDTYQTSANRKTDPGIDKSRMEKTERRRLTDQLQQLAGRLDLDALRSRSFDRFSASVDAVRSGLKPIGDFAKRFN
ncbi:MAG TPA: hypothetical protein VF889_08295, partial [Bacteroidota bacterium]